MNLEKFKTILLTNLVIISIFLTWNLWTYQSDLEKVTGDRYSEKIPNGKEHGEVIRPHQVAYHTKDKHYVSDINEDIKQVNHILESGKFEDVINSSHKVNEADFESYINGNEKIELIYPTGIPMEIVKRIYSIKGDKGINDLQIDRIVIDLGKKNGDIYPVYFISYKEKAIVKATLSPEVENAFSDIQSNFLTNAQEYSEYKLPEKLIYIPKEKRKVKYIDATAKLIDPEPFYRFLFPARYYTNGKTATDGTRQLKISSEGEPLAQLVFKNTTIDNDDRLAGSALIQRSLDFINGHKGWEWTDDSYFLDDWDYNSGKTTFRLFVNESWPVFSDATIRQEFRKVDSISYERPLYDLEIELSEDEKTLPSGTEFIQSLENSNKIDMKKISDIRIGYQIVQVEVRSKLDSIDYVKLDPVWAFEYEGEYYKFEGGEMIGLE
jgi:regulatory protein YycH of two-component signal transduction system YycFG